MRWVYPTLANPYPTSNESEPLLLIITIINDDISHVIDSLCKATVSRHYSKQSHVQGAQEG